jgi:hypothetical protein
MWPEKKNLFFSFTESPPCGHQPPNFNLGTLMDIRGLAERTESCHFKFIFSFNPDLYFYIVPRSVDDIKIAIKVEYKIKMNWKSSEKIKKIFSFHAPQ